MSFAFAIVGTGPSGFYAAESLLKARPGCTIDLFDRLPTPYGLVRSGIAPDHQSTKNVWRVYQRIAKKPEVRFLGNVELGRDVSLHELREAYDAVVLAVGSPVDKKLGIPGEDLPGVVGSAQVSGWYNGHPDWSGKPPPLGKRIVVIGQGNVAVDITRVLGRNREEMAKTDLPSYAKDAIEAAGIESLHMVGRRGPIEAAFGPVELRELGELARTVALVDASQLPEHIHTDDPKQQMLREKIVETLKGYAAHDPESKPARLHIRFYSAPVEIVGTDRVEGIVFEKTRVTDGRAILTGERTTVPCDLVVRAIGYEVRPLEGIDSKPGSGFYPNEGGRIAQALFAVGWAKRGPTGVVATNRQDSSEVVTRLVAELPADGKGGARERVDGLLRERGVKVVTFDDWEKIEKVELERAEGGAPRQKVTEWSELLGLAGKE